MDTPTILTDREQAFLRELVRRRVGFMIVGLSAAALQGTPAVTQDVDLWFKDLADPNCSRHLMRSTACMSRRRRRPLRCWPARAWGCSTS